MDFPEFEYVETPEGGLFVQTRDDTHPTWGLRSVNWHAGDSERIRGFANSQTDGANADAQGKAEKQSYAPRTWGNVWG